MKHIVKVLAFAAAIVCLASCGTSRNATKSSDTATVNKAKNTAEAYKEKVVSNFQTTQYLTAKTSIDLRAGSKSFSLGGSLKMKRDDVIQLSLTFFGMEVGRMEFTTTDVLIVDKVNKQYVRVPYSEASFLQSAELDFYSLQSLFWNEVFIPGKRDVASALSEFSVASSGDHTLLNLTSAPKLDYAFLTITEGALLNRTTVTSKNISDSQALVCKYDNFVKFGDKKFPSRVSLSFSGGKTELGLDMRLSSLSTGSSWETRTKVSSSYKQRSVDDVLGKLTMFQ